MVLERISKQGAQQCPASRQHGWTYTGWCFWQLGNFQILKIHVCAGSTAARLPAPSHFSFQLLLFPLLSIPSACLPPTVRPGVLTMHGGCKELIPSGQGTGKAKVSVLFTPDFETQGSGPL